MTGVKAAHIKTSMMACLQSHIHVSHKQCILTAENLERFVNLWVLVYLGKTKTICNLSIQIATTVNFLYK
ncbi:rCG39723, isoform CRA_a [Rattus norvegicus]|uniref:RCG39723, isoform CRA_a n=1 Tax=Rattus norvegicus TaxID=10116 RepID=A6I601_RAT|nr:rCG39723, isoform CRA_a [Rattus norvegicus]